MHPGLNYLATVYNGIDLALYPQRKTGGEDLIFIGRIHPDKGVHLAIETARQSGRRLLIAGICAGCDLLPGQKFSRTSTITNPLRGPGWAWRRRMPCSREAFALLHLNTIPERFGLVLAEANAAGVPVIAMDLGSCREVIEHGVTGFLVNDVAEAVRALDGVPSIEDSACRRRVEERFSIATMVEAYERVYATIFELERERS